LLIEINKIGKYTNKHPEKSGAVRQGMFADLFFMELLMAQRRMFSLKIVASDTFLEMPTSTRELYFQFGMYADDDGFLSPRKVIRLVGASDDDLKLLIAKRFVLPFENGIIVIKHWKINNLIRKDFYQESQYLELKKCLFLKDNGAYTDCKQNGNKLLSQDRLGKDRLGKDRLLTKPTSEEITIYAKEHGYNVDGNKVFTYYENNNWLDSRNKPVNNWKNKVLSVWCKEENKIKQYQKEYNEFEEFKKLEGIK
jgi:hypothetical protein